MFFLLSFNFKGRRTRIRYCNNPPPIAGGRKCIGRKTEVRWCKANLLCPINGGWTEWNLLECNATCAPGGVFSKRRWCNNPPAMFGGFVCPGSAFITGMPCNENVDCEEALMPKLSSGLDNEIQKNINKTLKNIEKNILKGYILDCNNLATSMFRNEIPSVKIYWTLNGNSIGLSPYSSFEGDSLFISKLYPFNAGVYTCEAEYWRSKTTDKVLYKIIDFWTLSVTYKKSPLPKTEILYDPRNFHCNADRLIELFHNWTIRWYKKVDNKWLYVKDKGFKNKNKPLVSIISNNLSTNMK